MVTASSGKTLTIAGIGPGSDKMVPPDILSLAEKVPRVFVRTQEHPSVRVLRDHGIKYLSFDSYYEEASDFESLYERIADTVLKSSDEEDTLYIVPGNPLIGEKSVDIILTRARTLGKSGNIRIIPTLSFVDSVFEALKMSAPKGYILIDAYEIYSGKVPSELSFDVPLVIFQVHDKFMASVVKLWLLEFLPENHKVFMVTAASVDEKEKVLEIPIVDLDREGDPDHLTSVVVPPVENGKSIEGAFVNFLSIIARLRGENGCPWDKKQTYQSLTRFLLEETYETVSAVFSQDPKKLQEELGDLLLEIGLYCRIASERGDFQVSDVISGISRKLVRRHPHVFGSEVLQTPEEVEKRWEEIKRDEPGRYSKEHSLMDEVERGLPALMQAQKQQALASEVGFDWDSAEGVFEKVAEEMNEVREAYVNKDQVKLREEIGDLLYACVNLARFLHVDAETALLESLDKFSRRFRQMENYLKNHNLSMEDVDLKSLDALWENIKKQEKEREDERKPKD